MFAITAITGRVGGVLADALLKAGHGVRAITREAAKGEAWAKRGCDVAVAAMDDAAALTHAFEGTEGVFVLLPPLYDPAPGFPEARAAIAAIRTALERARPPKVVVLSTIGADAAQPNLLNGLRFLEEALSTLGLPIAFLRAAWFMENAEWDVAAARDAGIIPSYLQPLDRALPMISVTDVGRTAATLLLEPWDGHRIVELQAAAAVAPNDIAAAFAKVLGRPVRADIVPHDAWDGLFRGQGMQNPLPRVQMLDGFNEGWIRFGAKGAERRIGGTTLETAIAALVVP